MNYLLPGYTGQCNPKAIEVTFLSVPAIDFFAQDQLQALQDWYLALGQGLESIDATVKCTKPTSEATAVAQTLLCRYQLGLGIYNVQAAVEGMDGGKRSHLLHLCGQLLRLVLIPYIKGEPYHWTRSTAILFAAELDGHVLGTLCAVTIAFTHQSAWPMYPRVIRGRQIQVNGRPHPAKKTLAPAPSLTCSYGSTTRRGCLGA